MLRIVLFILLAFPYPLYTQFNNIRFNHVSSDHNLFHYSINTIYQDKTGFLWIGTRRGLHLFDGYNFKAFKLTDDTNSLSGDYVRSIFEDSEGNLWIGTQSGLNKYIRNNQNFILYKNKKNDPHSISSEWIYGIVEDNWGNLWIATVKGLCRYNKKLNKFFNYFYNKYDIRTPQSDTISCIAKDRYGNLWIGTSSLGLDYIILDEAFNKKCSEENEVLNIHHFNFKSLKRLGSKQGVISKIFTDKENNIWIGTNTLGLFSFTFKPGANIKFEKNLLNLKPSYFSVNKGIKNCLLNNEITDIMQDNLGKIWISTFGGGINIFDDQYKTFHYLLNEVNNPYSLSNDYVNSLYEDRAGNVWVGTYTGGLNKYSPHKIPFTIYRNDPYKPGSPKNNFITSLFLDHDQICWLGTREGLNRLDRINNTSVIFSNNSSNKFSLTNNLVRAIREDNKGNLWVGTRYGLNYFDKKKNEFIPFNPRLRTLLVPSHIRALHFDKENILWIGAMLGLIKFNTVTNEFVIYRNNPSDPNSISASYVWSIYEDKLGNIWIGTSKGVNLFNKEKETFTNFICNTSANYFDRENIITTICEDFNGVIWISTYGGGLNKIISTNSSNSNAGSAGYELIEYDNILLNKEAINGTIVDNQNNLWFGTDKGIMKLSSDRKNVRIYDYRDGILENEFNSGSIFKNTNGELFFGSNNGMLSFFPDNISNNISPNIVLTSFSIFDSVIYSGTEASMIQNFNLSYKDNIFSFTFAALDFTEPRRNEFLYWLEGYDNHWFNNGNRNEIRYMNLSGGDYILHVKGSNNEGVFSEKELCIKLSIIPPLWERAWFRILLLVFLATVVYSYFKIRISRIERQKKLLANLVEIRTSDLKKSNELLSESNATKDKLFSIIAHDLRGPIGTIAGMLKFYQEEDDKNGEVGQKLVPAVIESAESTYVLLENLLDWASTQKDNINLIFENVNLALMVNNVLYLLKGIAANKSINLVSNVDPNLNARCDMNTISTVIRNLVSNALKYSSENGVVEISSTMENVRYIKISIRDHGIGIKPEVLKEILNEKNKISTRGTSGEKGTGLGLRLCVDFVKRNGGSIWVESELGKGTVFHFTVMLFAQN